MSLVKISNVEMIYYQYTDTYSISSGDLSRTIPNLTFKYSYDPKNFGLPNHL